MLTHEAYSLNVGTVARRAGPGPASSVLPKHLFPPLRAHELARVQHHMLPSFTSKPTPSCQNSGLPVLLR